VTVACNICGGTDFTEGPSGRLSATGIAPRCQTCRSLERHRAFRAAMDRIPRALLSWRSALQFAPDSSIDPTWFASFEGSVYGGENSIDVQQIPRPDGTYDFISLSHVMEFVPDDVGAFGELMRVGSHALILHIAFASTLEPAVSIDYDQPHGPFGRFHNYGSDFVDRFRVAERGLELVVTTASDPITGVEEHAYLLCRRSADAQALRTGFSFSTE
jgi:hypothetical protein